MVTLFIDTATDFLFCALVQDACVIDSLVIASEKKHSDMALYTIQEVLVKNNIQKDEIQRVCIGAGPGSYSGIRIARTIAKMMQLVSMAECYQFSTLEFLQALIKEENIALHAGRNQLYARIAENDQIVAADMFDGKVITSTLELKSDIPYEVLTNLTLVPIDEAPNYIKEALA